MNRLAIVLDWKSKPQRFLAYTCTMMNYFQEIFSDISNCFFTVSVNFDPLEVRVSVIKNKYN